MHGGVDVGNLDPKKPSWEGAAAASPRCHLWPPFPSEGSQELNTNSLKIQLPLLNSSALNADQFLVPAFIGTTTGPVNLLVSGWALLPPLRSSPLLRLQGSSRPLTAVFPT